MSKQRCNRSGNVPRLACWQLGCVLVVSLHLSARSELVYFAKGGELQISARSEKGLIRLEAPDRTYEFPLGDFRKIIPGHWPPAEWPDRRAKANEGTAEDRFRSIWWALENGLAPEAVALLRDSLERDAKYAPTSRMGPVLTRLDKVLTDPDLDRLKSALGNRYEIARGPHVILLHQHTQAEADERVDLLERVTATFYLMLAAQGVDLAFPNQRMASVWFAEHDDYVAFLKSEKADVFRTTRGYYHPTLNTVFAYDGRHSGTQKTSRESFSVRSADLSRLSRAIEDLPPRARLKCEIRGEPTRTLTRVQATSLHGDLQRDLERRQLLIDQEWRAIDLGVAAHEMVHQLVAASGFAPRHDAFPIWLHEGFAAQFEVIRGGRWAGVSRAHDLRLADWRKLPSPPLLLPLLHDSGLGQGYQRSAYAKAWALVYYLRLERPREFVGFLDLLRLPRDLSTRPTDPILTSFQAAFGPDLNSLEHAWQESMAKVRSPLEEGSKSPKPASIPPKPSSPIRSGATSK